MLDYVTMHDVLPPSPPPAVLAAIAVAAESYEQLRAADRELRFDVDDRTGRVSVSVLDAGGAVLFSVPPSKALAVAAGEGL